MLRDSTVPDMRTNQEHGGTPPVGAAHDPKHLRLPVCHRKKKENQWNNQCAKRQPDNHEIFVLRVVEKLYGRGASGVPFSTGHTVTAPHGIEVVSTLPMTEKSRLMFSHNPHENRASHHET